MIDLFDQLLASVTDFFEFGLHGFTDSGVEVGLFNLPFQLLDVRVPNAAQQ